MIPAIHVGSNAGVFFNTAMPTVVTMICLTLCVASLAILSVFKFKEVFEKENKALKESKDQSK
jgi:hypothetical protein